MATVNRFYTIENQNAKGQMPNTDARIAAVKTAAFIWL